MSRKRNPSFFPCQTERLQKCRFTYYMAFIWFIFHFYVVCLLYNSNNEIQLKWKRLSDTLAKNATLYECIVCVYCTMYTTVQGFLNHFILLHKFRSIRWKIWIKNRQSYVSNWIWDANTWMNQRCDGKHAIKLQMFWLFTKQ